ncbi:hypothetical protein THAOC_01852 [Thalassiosira oceanica]|uniref:DUF6743 domain-containing protein n=1 Tax=Thalassiosira oceanica TaxID=159749 RepID=K0TCD2_THAOC|nr:hypothetical protein THAOC_01852 [Thalassiosira oceanica]|eukprot:EJK76388.1 hypothetical protein THAOC_01852 [Thalassiosira oceanica]
MEPFQASRPVHSQLSAHSIPRDTGETTWEPTSTSTSTATPCFRAEILGSEPPGTPQIQQVYGAMNPLLAYTLAPMHLSAFYIPRGSGKTTWEPTSTSTSTATPCFRAEILGSEPPGTPQIQQVYGAMNPLLAYTLAPMHLSAFYIPRGSGKTTWEPVSTSTPTAAPCFHAEISYQPVDAADVRRRVAFGARAYYRRRGMLSDGGSSLSTFAGTASSASALEVAGALRSNGRNKLFLFLSAAAVGVSRTESSPSCWRVSTPMSQCAGTAPAWVVHHCSSLLASEGGSSYGSQGRPPDTTGRPVPP